MSEVTGLTAAKMTEIANASVVTGAVDGGTGHLILTTAGGDTVDAGDVIGPTGATGATGADGPDGVNVTGTVVMFAASLPPTGWLMCDGTAVSRSTYSALFSAIGTTFGSGNGTTTFNVPNMQQKYARQDSGALGVTGGADTHAHTITDHDHQIEGGSPTATAHIFISTGAAPNLHEETTFGDTYNPNFQSTLTSAASSTLTGQTAGAVVTGHTNDGELTTTLSASTQPPYLNLNFIIKT